MTGACSPTILHADLDAFFASVEQLLDPGLAGRPIAVGGGVVLAASYEARAHGVRGGMGGRQARALCPDLRFVPGHFSEYSRLGDAVMDVLSRFTPHVERVSIDEAFLDVGGSVHLFGPPSDIAGQIRHAVRTEVGLPISVGAATTKHLAKVASQVAKPDGLVVVDPSAEREFLDPLPVELLWGVGPVTHARLADRGIRTIGELAVTSPAMLASLLGRSAGFRLAALAANVDERRVRGGARARSVGAQAAIGRRPPDAALVRTTIGYLADRVARRLRARARAGRTVTIRVRFADLRSVTRSLTLPQPTSSTLTITEVGVALVETALRGNADEREISLLAVSLSNLATGPGTQLELPVPTDDPHRSGTPSGVARGEVDRAMDAVRDRFGRDAVGYASVRLSTASRVPVEFRELVERNGERSRELVERNGDVRSERGRSGGRSAGGAGRGRSGRTGS